MVITLKSLLPVNKVVARERAVPTVAVVFGLTDLPERRTPRVPKVPEERQVSAHKDTERKKDFRERNNIGQKAWPRMVLKTRLTEALGIGG